jgi:hypothetical protein
MAQTTIRIKARIAWWVRPYVECVVLWAKLSGREPDMDKVYRLIYKGVHVEVAR